MSSTDGTVLREGPPPRLLAIFQCCRDWPVNPLQRLGKCGYCGQVPEWTDKTIEQYMAEREIEGEREQ